MPTATRRRGQQPLPGPLRAAFGDLLRGGQGAGHVQPRRVHRIARRTASSGPATRTPPGRRSAASLTAGLTAAACGILYWGWDLGGFSGPTPSAELYLRSTAAAAIHADHAIPLGVQPPPHAAARPNPVEHRRRQTGNDGSYPFPPVRPPAGALIPYLAEQARQAISDGRPLMRALMFDHHNDPKIWQHPRNSCSATTYSSTPSPTPGPPPGPPTYPGDWVDIWTGAEVAGGGVHTRTVPIEVIPVYCRRETWPELRLVFGGR